MTHIRGTQLVTNKQNDQKEHIPFAFLEKQGQPDEAYRHIDCTLVIKETNICQNCKRLQKTLKQIQQRILAGVSSVKTVHASKDILLTKINQQRKTIQNQTQKISYLRDQLQEKIEEEEEAVSDEIATVVHQVSERVVSKATDIANLHPIFQELIRIQCGKPNGTRYHPM